MDPASTYFFTQGILGVIVVVLGVVCIYLYRQVTTLQNARLQDSKDNTKEVTEVLQDNSQNLRILSEKIEVGKSLDRRR